MKQRLQTVLDMSITGATAVVINEERQVLLHRRRDFRVWALPGGTIEPDETGELAAVREVREETGYEIAIERFVGEYWRPQIPNGNGLVYLGRVIGGTPMQRGPETREVRWFPLNALPASLPRTHRVYIQDAISPAGAPVKRTLRMSLVEVLIIRLARWLRGVWQKGRRG